MARVIGLRQFQREQKLKARAERAKRQKIKLQQFRAKQARRKSRVLEKVAEGFARASTKAGATVIDKNTGKERSVEAKDIVIVGSQATLKKGVVSRAKDPRTGRDALIRGTGQIGRIEVAPIEKVDKKVDILKKPEQPARRAIERLSGLVQKQTGVKIPVSRITSPSVKVLTDRERQALKRFDESFKRVQANEKRRNEVSKILASKIGATNSSKVGRITSKVIDNFTSLGSTPIVFGETIAALTDQYLAGDITRQKVIDAATKTKQELPKELIGVFNPKTEQGVANLISFAVVAKLGGFKSKKVTSAQPNPSFKNTLSKLAKSKAGKKVRKLTPKQRKIQARQPKVERAIIPGVQVRETKTFKPTPIQKKAGIRKIERKVTKTQQAQNLFTETKTTITGRGGIKKTEIDTFVKQPGKPRVRVESIDKVIPKKPQITLKPLPKAQKGKIVSIDTPQGTQFTQVKIKKQFANELIQKFQKAKVNTKDIKIIKQSQGKTLDPGSLSQKARTVLVSEQIPKPVLKQPEIIIRKGIRPQAQNKINSLINKAKFKSEVIKTQKNKDFVNNQIKIQRQTLKDLAKVANQLKTKTNSKVTKTKINNIQTKIKKFTPPFSVVNFNQIIGSVTDLKKKNKELDDLAADIKKIAETDTTIADSFDFKFQKIIDTVPKPKKISKPKKPTKPVIKKIPRIKKIIESKIPKPKPKPVIKKPKPEKKEPRKIRKLIKIPGKKKTFKKKKKPIIKKPKVKITFFTPTIKRPDKKKKKKEEDIKFFTGAELRG